MTHIFTSDRDRPVDRVAACTRNLTQYVNATYSTRTATHTLQQTHCNTHYDKTCQRYIFPTNCNTLQHTAHAIQQNVSTLHIFNTRLHTAAHCNILQHTATHCNTLHAQSSKTLSTLHAFTFCYDTLKHAEIHYNTLQKTKHAATRCNMLQRGKRTDLQQQGVRENTRRVVMVLLVVAAQILFRGAVVCIL